MSAGIKNARGHSHGHSHENVRENARGDSHEWGRCLMRHDTILMSAATGDSGVSIRKTFKVFHNFYQTELQVFVLCE